MIFATERARRPGDFASEELDPPTANCPFCAGHESQTPPEIYASRPWGSKANGDGWRVRVVPNKYPALRIEGELEKWGDGPYDRMLGVGAHEVFIEGGEHASTVTGIPADTFREVVRAYRERLLDLKKDRRLVHALIFKNVGRRAGASLSHNHSQLIATPVVPIVVEQEIAGAKQFFDYRGRCIFCDVLRHERGAKSRIVLDRGGFVAIAPYASRFPFETWVLPSSHFSHFETLTDPQVDAFADVVLTVLGQLERALGNVPYNYVLHSAPFANGPLEHYHWHLEIMPRVTMTAGFEWGSGFYINPVSPEDAARFLAGGAR